MLEPSRFLSSTPARIKDPEVPGADRVLDASALELMVSVMGGDSSRAPQFVYVRHKPGVKVMVGVCDAAGDIFTFQALTASAADVAWEKIRAKGVSSSHRYYFSGSRIIGLRWPWDQRLPGIRQLTPGKAGARLVRRWLPQYATPAQRLRTKTFGVTPLRYKPERHAVLLLDFVLRHGPGQKTPKRLIARAVSTGPRRFQPPCLLPGVVPELLATETRIGLSFEAFVSGGSLDAWISGKVGEPTTESGKDFFHAGALLARFHREATQAWADAPTPPSIAPSSLAVPARDHLRAVAPELANRWSRVAAEAERLIRPSIGEEQVMLHGDLHPGQFVGSGSDMRLVDLDKCRPGPPSRDVGRFLHHLEADTPGVTAPSEVRRAWGEAFLQGYGEAGSLPGGSTQLQGWKAFAALERAAAPYRNCHEDAQRWSRMLIESALENSVVL